MLQLKVSGEELTRLLWRRGIHFGNWQRRVIWGSTSVSALRGKAKDYDRNYRNSFYSILQKLDAQGVDYEQVEGPRGGFLGRLSGDYTVTATPEEARDMI